MTTQYLLGIDAGTSVIKASLYDTNGREIASSSQRVQVYSPHSGWSEQDMNETWLATALTIKETIAGIDPAQIVGVCPTGQGDGAWMIDANGEPVRPAPLWNDGRAADIIARWEANGVIEAAYKPGGTVVWPGTAASVLVWVRENEPENYERISTIFFCKDWIKYRLTGEICTDLTDGSIPFMDVANHTYDKAQLERLELADIHDKLPRLTQSHEVIGEITAEAAEATGLAVGTPVVSGMMDVNANAIGVGAIKAGQSFTILGTTGINCTVLDQPVFDPPNIGASACHAIPNSWIRVLGAMAGTPNLDWYLDNMGEIFRTETTEDNIFTHVQAAVATAPAGAGGVIFHPYLRGERAPFLNPAATGGFFGITAETTRAHLVRAVYEGVAFSVKHCYHLMGGTDLVMLAGGGANSDIWRQILADMLNCPIVVPAGSEFGTLGAAMTAGVGVGVYSDFAEAVKTCVSIDREYTPQPENVAVYDAMFPLYTSLIEYMGDFWKQRQQILRTNT